MIDFDTVTIIPSGLYFKCKTNMDRGVGIALGGEGFVGAMT